MTPAELAVAPPDRDAVAARVDDLSQVLDAHAGGLELNGIEADGTVTVRFTGMCTGCPLRPVSLAGLVRPALLALDGVQDVHAEGGRLSKYAQERMATRIREDGSATLLNVLCSKGGASRDER